MNVYIYGNSGFKKEIHETLEHANIKFKLDANSVIKDINNLEELKTIIKNNPNDIYLIDDEKIIKKDGFSKKIKFLTPKDGIEEEFLLDNGIADLSVDSLKEIPKYILEKHEQQRKSETQDIQNSIADIVDDAYSKEEEKDNENNTDNEKNNDLDFSDDFELDAELASLLEKDESSPVEIIEEEAKVEEDFGFNENEDNLMSEKELENLMNFEDDMGLSNTTSDYDEKSDTNENEFEDFKNELNSDDNEIDSLINDLENDDIINQLDNELDFEPIEENIEEDHEDLDELLNEDSLSFDEPSDKIEDTIQGEKMSDEFSELDSLSEADILSAIESLDDVAPLETKSVEKTNSSSSSVKSEQNSIEVNSSSAQDITELITKLLNNKTLEITIKIKD